MKTRKRRGNSEPAVGSPSRLTSAASAYSISCTGDSWLTRLKMSREEELADELKQELSKKRYLLVIDGLGSFSDWKSLLTALPDKENGSRVVLITRLEDKEVAYFNPTTPPVRIDNLQQEESNKLFLYKLGSMDDQHQISRKDLKAVFSITGGLPLAIIVLAGLLRNKIGTDEWGSIIRELQDTEETRRFKRLLQMSFDDLPHHLQPCFLYFAAMPQNLVFRARRLLSLWIAEGFVKHYKHRTMEEVGEWYMKKLISRGLVHLVKKDPSGGIWLVSIHCRLHTFAQREAEETNFLCVQDATGGLAEATVRRLYLQNYSQCHWQQHHALALPKVRSFLCDSAEERLCCLGASDHTQVSHGLVSVHPLKFLFACKFIRVICIRGMKITSIPQQIGNLINLRYLGLRCSSLASLPSSIRKLTNLQTLDIRETLVRELDEAFWRIPTLRQIFATGLLLPQSVATMNSLQTLREVSCPKTWKGSDANPFLHMIHLRHMKILGLLDVHWNALLAALERLQSLMFLHLAGDKVPDGFLSHYSLQGLQILEIDGAIDDQSDVCFALPNLTRLTLKSSRVTQRFIDKIATVPSLSELILSQSSYKEEKLTFKPYLFGELKDLTLVDIEERVQLIVQSHAMPKLKRMVVSGCPNMKMSFVGEQVVRDLKELVVFGMPGGFIHSEPRHLNLRKKIIKAAGSRASDEITDPIQRAGKWRVANMDNIIFMP